MATAPRPGVGDRAEAAKAAQQILRIRIKDQTYTLAAGNLPMGEKLAVRKQVGLPIETFISDDDHFGEDSVAVLVWLARRAEGEPDLTWRDASKDWDALDLTEGDLEVDIDDVSDAKGDDPEA